MRPRKPYKGVLRRKLPSPEDTPVDEWCLAVHERIVALAEHQGLDWRLPSTTEALFAMGRDRVEGFQIAKKSGMKPKPGQAGRDIALFWEVWQGRKKGQKDTFAYRRIAKRRGVKEDEIDKAVTTLRKRFNDLTQPKTEAQRRAALRMWRTVVELTGEDQKK